MKKMVLAVFDDNREYIYKFSDYIKRKKKLPFETLGFSDREALWNYVESNKIDVLLFSQEEFTENEKTEEDPFVKFLSHKNVKKFVYLGKQKKTKSAFTSMNKYQSMETLIKEIMEIMEFHELDEFPQACPLIGIYSVVPGEEAFQASLRIGSNLALDHSILYITFDRFSILDSDQTGKFSLSDLIYFYKTNPKKIKEELKNTVGHYRGFDFLTTPSEQCDIDELNFAEWKDFFSQLLIDGNYEQIVVDLQEAFKNLEEIFSYCERVYVPIEGNTYALKKAKMLQDYFSGRGRQDLVEKLVMMNLDE